MWQCHLTRRSASGCYGRVMSERTRLRIEGGIGLMIGLLAGVLLRNVWAGLAIGVISAFVLWMLDRSPDE